MLRTSTICPLPNFGEGFGWGGKTPTFTGMTDVHSKEILSYYRSGIILFLFMRIKGWIFKPKGL